MVRKINGASQRGFPRVLWTADPVRLVETEHLKSLARPAYIFSAAPASAILAWLEVNHWARNVPLMFWDPDAAHAAKGMPGGDTWAFQEPGEGFHMVGGARALLQRRGSMITRTARPDIVVASAESLARMVKGTIWELHAGASGGGLLAIGAAYGQGGPAVAVDAGTPTAFAGAVANAWGVPLRVVAHGEHRARLADETAQ